MVLAEGSVNSWTPIPEKGLGSLRQKNQPGKIQCRSILTLAPSPLLLFIVLTLFSNLRIVSVSIGNFTVDALAVELRTGEDTHDLAGIGLLHIKERIAGQEVDTAHIHTLAGDELVEHINQVAGKEAVALADIDVDTLESTLCRATILLLVVLRTFMLLTLTALALGLGRLGVNEVDVGSILVVVEKTVEFE